MMGGGRSEAFLATLTSARAKIDPLSLTAAQLYQPASLKANTEPGGTRYVYVSVE